jgi:hypothetical protein
MINVHVQLTAAGRVFWTSPIKNPAALKLLVADMKQRGIRADVYDDQNHAYVADGCFVIASQEQRIGEISWGPKAAYRCDIAEMPRATGELPECRDFAPPLPEEVAQCTPCCCDTSAPLITAFDVHGSPDRSREAPARPVEVQPRLQSETWIDRLLRLVTGTPRGKAGH